MVRCVGYLATDQLLSTASGMLDPANAQGELSQRLRECTLLHQVLLNEAEAKQDWSLTPVAAAFVDLLQASQALGAARFSSGGGNSSPSQLQDICRACLLRARICFGGGGVGEGEGGGLGDEQLWIVKPVALSCGEGISVQQGARRALLAAQALRFKCVVQKYLERPLLLRRGQKFDIRQWALVTSVDPLVMFGFSECYLRLSSRPYSTEATGLAESLIHLCNQSIQGGAGGEEHEHEHESDTMMSQGEFDAFLRQMDTRLFALQHPGAHAELVASGRPFTFNSVLLPQIRRVCLSAVGAARDRLQRVGRGFEWLGFDLMVTRSLQVRLIEVNVSPDTTASTRVTGRLVKAATADLFRLLLDEGAADDVGGQKQQGPGGVLAARQMKVKEEQEESEGIAPPLWGLWHWGERETAGEVRAWAAAKQAAGGVLRVADNSAPPNESLVARALAVLSCEGGGEEEEEEDEL